MDAASNTAAAASDHILQWGPQQHETEGWPLLHLPGPAAGTVVALAAQERSSLRLACHATLALVDMHTMELRRHCLAGALTTPLAQRFPRVNRLQLSCPDPCGSQDADTDAALSAGAQLLGSEQQHPWASVTALKLNALPAAAVAVIAASCPNIATCHLSPPKYKLGAPAFASEEDEDLEERDCYVADEQQLLSLGHLCGGLLPHLTALHANARIPGPHLQLIAGCSTLRNLNLYLDGSCSEAACGALFSMRLQELHLVTDFDWEPGPAELAGLRDMTTLTLLKMLAFDLPQLLALLPALPNSLVSLTHLAMVQDESQDYVPILHSVGLVDLATKCPALASLSFPTLTISPLCHSAPLTALTQLTVKGYLEAHQGVRLSLICPNLRSLSLCCVSELADGAAVLENLASLVCLSLGDHRGAEAIGLDLGVDANQQVLAALPQLTELRCLGQEGHIRGCGALSQLRSISITFNSVLYDKRASLCSALRNAPFPAAVLSASLKFLSPDRIVARAAQLFLVRAAHLTSLCWATGTALNFQDISDETIWILASIPGITHLTFEGWHADATATAMLHHVTALHSSRPLKLVMHSKQNRSA